MHHSRGINAPFRRSVCTIYPVYLHRSGRRIQGCLIMERTPKELLKAYVDSQKFNSTTEIMDAMKEMFRDVLQQVARQKKLCKSR